MNKPVVQLGPDAVKQVAKTVRENARRIINERPRRARWQQQQPPIFSTPSGTRVYTLAIRGTADGGTISWEAKKIVIVDDEPTTVTETGTWDFDADETDIQSSLVSFDSGVLVTGGDIRWNICKIRFYDTTARLKITATSLTREEHGITPQAELSWCGES